MQCKEPSPEFSPESSPAFITSRQFAHAYQLHAINSFEHTHTHVRAHKCVCVCVCVCVCACVIACVCVTFNLISLAYIFFLQDTW